MVGTVLAECSEKARSLEEGFIESGNAWLPAAPFELTLAKFWVALQGKGLEDFVSQAKLAKAFEGPLAGTDIILSAIYNFRKIVLIAT